MPLLFALGQHRSLVEASRTVEGNEIVFAYLDDVFAACGPPRVASMHTHTSVEEELFVHANIHVHHGKTSLEQGMSDIRRHRGTHQSCQTGEARCCVERRSGTAPCLIIVESLGSADWSGRIRARFPGEKEQGTRDLVQQNPSDQRPPSSLAPPLDACFHESKLLTEGR